MAAWGPWPSVNSGRRAQASGSPNMWVTLPSAFRSRWRRIFGSLMTQWSRRDVLADTNDYSARGRGADPSFTSRFHTGTEIRAGAAEICAPSRGAHNAHWTLLADWQHAFPEATTWAVPGLSDRLQVRVSKVPNDRKRVDVPPPDWRGEVDQGLLRGGSVFCECYMFHRSSRTLILCNAVQDLESEKLPPLTRVIARLIAPHNSGGGN